MKKTLTIVAVFLLLATLYSNAQSKYGDVTIDELDMAVYPQDTTAAALILLKEGNLDFIYDDEAGFQYQYTLKMKIKILKNEGLGWCDQEIPYYEADRLNKERITHLSGTTYNADNRKIIKTKLSKEFIFDESINEKNKLKKFTLSGAKVGSVIEFKYTIVSDYYYDLREFYFQSSIPTQQVSFEVITPEYLYYNLNMQGYEKIDATNTMVNANYNIRYKDDNGRMQSTMHTCNAKKTVFRGNNIKALKNESYVWTLGDYISKVTFELSNTKFPNSMTKSYTTTWANVDKDILDAGVFGGNLKKTGLFKNDISTKEINIENAKEILNMIKYKVKWNEKNAFYPSDLGDVLKKGLGNSADMNFLLINALKSGGFDAYPVVLSTRSNGRLPVTHPSISALNYTIVGVKIDTMMYYTDASAKFGDWNLLPQKCMVPQARALLQQGGDWVDLSAVSIGMMAITNDYKFEGGEYKGRISITRRGNDALSFRDHYADYKDNNEYLEKLTGQLACEVVDFEISGADNAAGDVKEIFIVKPDVTLGDEFLYINPFLIKHFSENPFKDENRTVPVNFNYLQNYRQIVNIMIPEGYAVEETIQSEKILLDENESMVLTCRVGQTQNSIQMNYQFQLKSLQFLQTDYELLRNFFAKIVLKNSEQIVLKKIS
ncbi:DUF3857 domain-containing protein [Dysgonomonas sp. ZJ279]|uniref:DUF3857 domain-containing protein n=1 Tax=Dysgonomonas sp. ZJ279 TaxID=2709796 RepID=UPI0013EA0987|nr:DUF3857 domain-containing protein [Dysgonomonas sp. ZJ279]